MFSTAKLFKILMTTELTVDENGVGYYCIPSIWSDVEGEKNNNNNVYTRMLGGAHT